MTVNVRKCCITGALWSKGNALSVTNRTLLASRVQHHFVNVNKLNSHLPSIDPSETYRVIGIELNNPLTFTKHWRELKRTTKSLINALSTSPLKQSHRFRVSRGLLIGEHFTLLLLGLFSDSQLDTLGGQLCRTLRFAVSSVRNLPRTALHRPTTDRGYGLPSLKSHAA
jgi:hypothetical protein